MGRGAIIALGLLLALGLVGSGRAAVAQPPPLRFCINQFTGGMRYVSATATPGGVGLERPCTASDLRAEWAGTVLPPAP